MTYNTVLHMDSVFAIMFKEETSFISLRLNRSRDYIK